MRFVSGLALVVLLFACGSDAEVPTSSAPAAAPRTDLPPVPVPAFDADSAYAYVAKQVAFGPRVMNTDAHEAAKEWMVQKLANYGAKVIEQNFTATAYDGTKLESTNIIARFNPEMADRMLLAAHYDTRHVADSELENDPAAVVNGADDGASGVGVLLEIARQLSASAPNIGVDIVLFDAEDYGEGGGGDQNSWGLGAQHYSRNLPPNVPRYGILLDMVGAKDARFAVEGVSERYAPDIVNKVWGLASTMSKFAPYFPRERGKAVTDDHYFVNTIARIPMIDIINFRKDTKTGFVAHWHTGDDDLDVIDKETLRAVGQVVTAVVYREGNGTI
ncbi:glutamine cyclotransferase [Lewinella sp. 4G2]|nr:glutamine cyclotransferase [Lewinella sp. 4G2]